MFQLLWLRRKCRVKWCGTTCLQEAPLEISWRSDRDWQEWHDASPASTSYSSSLQLFDYSHNLFSEAIGGKSESQKTLRALWLTLQQCPSKQNSTTSSAFRQTPAKVNLHVSKPQQEHMSILG